MKYFWAFIIIVLAIAAGGHFVDYKSLLQEWEVLSNDSKNVDKNLNDKIAYSLLTAMAEAESLVQQNSEQDIRYIVHDDKGEAQTKRYMFENTDYKIFATSKESQIVLKQNSLRKFYYTLDNLVIKELPQDMRQSIHTKLKERYEFVQNVAKNLHDSLTAQQVAIARLNKEQQKAQALLQKKQQEATDIEKKRQKAQSLLEQKQKEMKELAKKKKEMELFFKEKKQQTSSLEEKKKKVEALLQKKKQQALLLEKKKKEAERLLHKSRKEKVFLEKEQQKTLLLLKKKKQEADDLIKKAKSKNKNAVKHDLFPLGKGFFWKYRVKKYLDKSISEIAFSAKKRDGEIFLEDNKNSLHRIKFVNGFIKKEGKKILPCALKTKTWQKEGYTVVIKGKKWISTCAGTFHCIVVYAKLQQNPSNVVKEYYAPEIGKVKQVRFAGGKKIYEQTLIEYKTDSTYERLNRSKPFPKNATYFPVQKQHRWEYDILKYEENRISSMQWRLIQGNGNWRLKDNSDYAPSIAVAEGFVLRGLQKLVPLHAKNPQTWQRDQYNVYISHFGEIVTTDMGNFECLVVVAKHKKKKDYVIKEYYADKIGEVKSEIYHQGKKIYTRILRKFQ
ncbi:hypothetical protein [Candidatus Uabimicrobium sp. HlEnr_7]|uniref:cell envelope integrity protein TolA n=1 Tax=Candidatus Uabimicrobium helgolandensis TaxID=3095367 RepID=UPI003558EE21